EEAPGALEHYRRRNARVRPDDGIGEHRERMRTRPAGEPILVDDGAAGAAGELAVGFEMIQIGKLDQRGLVERAIVRADHWPPLPSHRRCGNSTHAPPRMPSMSHCRPCDRGVRGETGPIVANCS